MSGFLEEFGFIPPELLYKCDQYVKEFHKRRGSGKDFVVASHIFSARSPYLHTLEKNFVAIGKGVKFAVITAIIVTIAAAALTTWRVLGILAPVGLISIYYFNKMGDSTLVQQRAIILAVEVLATDFARWGTLFPKARGKAEPTVYRDDTSDWPKLLDLYLPPERRRDTSVVDLFAPSQGAIASEEVSA